MLAAGYQMSRSCAVSADGDSEAIQLSIARISTGKSYRVY
jgi:hypothetical protein